MEFLLRRKNTRSWSLLVAVLMVFQVLALAAGPIGVAQAADPAADQYADQPGAKSKWYVAGSFQGWNNSNPETQLKHLVGGYYALSLVLDAGHHEFKIVKNGSWDGFSNNGNNFAFDLSGKTKVNFYVNEEIGQARISVPGVGGLEQYVPKVGADKWPRLVGTVQGAFGEPNWSPENAKQMFVDYKFDGSVYKIQRTFAPGSYEAKVAFGPNWDENYGADGRNGANLALNVLDPADVTLTLDMSRGALSHDYKPVDGASDGRIDKSKLFFDSRNLTHKKPFGAVAELSQDVTFRIGTAKDDVQMAKLDVTNKDGLTSSFPMKKVTTVGESDYYEATVPKNVFKGIGVFGYKFILIDGAAKVEYGDDGTRGGTGAAADEGALPFDLTVYDRNFKTPDWMKNAVVYQIFPDRFFDGEPANNRAKTVDGYRGTTDPAAKNLTEKGAYKYQYFDGGVKKEPTPDQVAGVWSDVPENPNRTTPENAPYYPGAKTDGQWTNEFYGGDIQGVEQKLGYLKSIGVTVIYFNPVAWAASNHKYDATDYKHLDPMFGEPVYNKPNDPSSGLDYVKTREKSDRIFSKFAKEAKKQGIRLIVDGVFNHVGDDSIYFDRYEKYPEIGAYEYWSKVWNKVNDEKKTQAQAEQEVRAAFTAQVNPMTGTNYKYPEDFEFTTWFSVKNEKQGDRYKYEAWWGFDSLPASDAVEPQPGDALALPGAHEWNVPSYRDHVIGHDLTGLPESEASKKMQHANSQRWEWLGAQGWRLDVAPDVSGGTWQKFRTAVKSVEGRLNANGEPIEEPLILGEEWGVATHFLLGDQFDSVMNYRFRGALMNFIQTGDANKMHQALESIREDYPAEAWQVMLNLVDSHDTPRSITLYDHPDWENEHLAIAPEPSAKALQDQMLTAIFQMGYPGAPTVYYGDEVGQAGTRDPDSRRSFPWERVSEGKKGEYAGTGRYAEIFKTYQAAANLRNAEPVFRTGEMKQVGATQDVIAYARKNDAKAGLVAINRGGQEAKLELSVGGFLPDGLTMEDKLGGSIKGVIQNGKLALTLPAKSGVMMVSKETLKEVPAVTGVAATGGNGQVRLSWNGVQGAASYNIYGAAIDGGAVTKVGTTTGTEFIDSTVKNGQKYYYAVTAVIGTSEGSFTDMASATPAFPVGSVMLTQLASEMTVGVGKTTSEVQAAISVPGLTNDEALAGKEAPGLTARLAYYKQGTSKEVAMDTKLRFKTDAEGRKIYYAAFEPNEAGAWNYFAKVTTNSGETWTVSAEGTVLVKADGSDTAAPAAPVLGDILQESNRAHLRWESSGTDVAGFDILRTANGVEQKVATVAKDAREFVDFTVTNDTEYAYKVAAFDAAYNRSASAAKVVVPKIVMVDVTLRLHLPDTTPTHEDIAIAGTINNWNASSTKLTLPSGAVNRSVMEYNFKMMAGKQIEYKYTRGTWETEAFTSHARIANDTTDFGNWAYGSTDTNMKLTIQNQGGNKMVVNDYVLRWADMPMVVQMPRHSTGGDIAYTTTDDKFTLKANVPYGVAFTINGTPLPAGAMDSFGNVYLENIPLNKGLNLFELHIEPTDETLNLPWYTDKGRKSMATKTLKLSITRQ